MIVFFIIVLLVDGTHFVNKVNDKGETGLILAIISHGKQEMTNKLLEYGSDCNIKDNHGKTAVDYAIEFERLESLKILLAYGCNDTTSKSVFYYTRKCDHEGLKELVEDSGISIDVVDGNRCTLFSLGIKYGCGEEFLLALINLDMDPNKEFPKSCSVADSDNDEF